MEEAQLHNLIIENTDIQKFFVSLFAHEENTPYALIHEDIKT